MSFPSFQSWMKALKLSLPAYLGAMVFPFFGWSLLALTMLVFVSDASQPDRDWLTLILLIMACFAIGLVFYSVLKLLWWLVLKLLWSKPPGWLLPATGIRQNLHSFVILTVATVPLTVIFLLMVMTETSFELMTEREMIYASQLLPTFVIRFYWLWLLSAAYLIHWFPIKSPVDEQGQRLPIRK